MKASPSKLTLPGTIEPSSQPLTPLPAEKRVRAEPYTPRQSTTQGQGVALASRVAMGNMDACLHLRDLMPPTSPPSLKQELNELIHLISETRKGTPLETQSLERKIQLQTHLARMIEGLPLGAVSLGQR